MSETSASTVEQAAETVTIEILRPDGSQSRRELASGDPLFVGSASSCGLRLEGEDVAAVHCWLRVTDGELWVQNWVEGCVTLIDDRRVAEAERLAPREVLSIGQARITLSNAASPGLHAPAPTGSLEFNHDDSPGDVFESSDEETEGVVYDATGDEPEPTPQPVEETHDVGADDTASDVWDAWNDAAEAQPAADVFDSGSEDAFERETIELLRAEVEFLQSELLERDTRIAELSASTDVDESFDGDEDGDDVAEETEALLERLENMLQELSHNDQTVRQMEQLLQVSEEALEAEREERAQLEAWLEGIESRLVAREQEWQSEVDALTKRLQYVSAERDRAEKLVGGQAATPAAAENQQTLVDELRREVDGLREELQKSQCAGDELQQQVASMDFDELERTSRERIEAELREERLQLAEERTELARLRAELTRANSDAEVQQSSSAKTPDPVTAQVQVLRQHLREIHEKEKTERDERRISKRIARLWKRLDD